MIDLNNLTEQQYENLCAWVRAGVDAYIADEEARGILCFRRYDEDNAAADAEGWSGPYTARVFRPHTHAFGCWCAA